MPSTFPASLIALGRDIFARAGRRAAAREASYNLAALDDHLLRDIGIDRAGIARAVRGDR